MANIDHLGIAVRSIEQAQRLYQALGLHGVVRGRRVRTTIPEVSAERSLDLVQRNFTADRPDALWLTDITAHPKLAKARSTAT